MLCGLMPGSGTSSAQLHTVISLVCGMGNDPHSHDEPPTESPMTRLKDSVSSPQAFKKHFLVGHCYFKGSATDLIYCHHTSPSIGKCTG